MSRPIPTRRAALLAVAVGLLLLAAPVADGRWSEVFVLANLVLVAVFVVDLLLAPAPTSFSIARVHPSAVTVGARAAITWEATRHGRRATSVWLADDLAPSLTPDTRRARIDVPSDGTGTATVWFSPTRRGRFEPETVVVRTRGPLGLVERQRSRSVPTRLRVIPAFRSAKEAQLAIKQARLHEVGLRSTRSRGEGTEFDHLREMTPDDETRRIDWAATARSQRPIVRTYRTEQNQTVVCLLDSGRVMAGRVNAIPRFEYGMDAAMVLAEVSTALGDRMGLLVFDRTVHTTIPPSNRRSQRAAVAETLFTVEPALAESDYRSMVTHVTAHFRRRHLIVLLTELTEETIEAFVLPALPILTRTHLVAVVSVRDPDVATWAASGRADVEGAFLRAAAVDSLAVRDRLAATLRSRGVLVVDAEPDRFGAAVAELYLDAKAVGRL